MLLVIPALLLSPPGEPLDVDVFDASGLPSVVFDVTAPRDLAVENLSSASVQIEGGNVESMSPVDPTQVAVSLVIDDSPSMSKQAVVAGQGASVELVRLTGEGTQISLSTPSGLLTALTTDRAANIARIAGIVAGSPDVIPMPKLVLDAANRLAQTPQRDRHLVVVLGTPLPAGPVLDELREVALAAGIRLHVVTATPLDIEAIAAVSAETGGISPDAPAAVGEIDAVTRTIADRYRVVATVDGAGPHEVTLTAGDRTYAGELDVVPPPIPTAAASSAGSVAPTTTTVTGTPSQAVTPNTATPQAAAPSASAGTTAGGESSERPAGMGRVARLLGVFALVLVVIAGWAAWIAVRNRSARHKAQVPASPPSPDGPQSAPPVDGGAMVARDGAMPLPPPDGPAVRAAAGPPPAVEIQPVDQPVEVWLPSSVEAPMVVEPEPEPVITETAAETAELGLSNVEEPDSPPDVVEPDLSPVGSIVPEPDAEPHPVPLVPDLDGEPQDLTTLPDVAVEAPESPPEPLAAEPEPVAELSHFFGGLPETLDFRASHIETPVDEATGSQAAGAEREAVEPEPDVPPAIATLAADVEPILAPIDVEAAASDQEADPATADAEVGTAPLEPEAGATEPAAPEPVREPAVAEVEDLAPTAAMTGSAEHERREPESEAVEPPEPEPVARRPAGTVATGKPAPAGETAGEHRPRRRSVLNDRPRHVSSRRAAAESAAGVEVFEAAAATDAEPRAAAEDEQHPVRRRRGLPADRPRRTRTRRRFDDIPPIEAAEPPSTPPPS